MAILTAYARFSNEELLTELSNKRKYSQLLEELCQRVEQSIKDKWCPICEGNIEKCKLEEES